MNKQIINEQIIKEQTVNEQTVNEQTVNEQIIWQAPGKLSRIILYYMKEKFKMKKASA